MAIDYFYFVASSIAALVARLITYPLDTIKTRLQTRHDRHYSPILQDSFPKPPPSSLNAFTSLYRGLSITLLFSVPAMTLYLCAYEWIKTLLFLRPLLVHAIAGCFAELTAGLFFTPMEVIKSQLQIDQLETNTTWSLVCSIGRQEGLAGFYKGYWITIAVFLPHTVTYFVVYEQLKGLWKVEDQIFIVFLLCAAIASALSIVVSTPLDIVKTRWQVSAQDVAFQGGPIKIAKQMWKYEGKWRAFTQGMAVRIAWGIPLTTITMAVYEQLIHMHK
ncbi:mitochondrial carrier domain-containing protein [Thamnidium elegans]|nr:mitochondrial carrier domain-containing protein [Thamnidium elegans]